MMGRGNDASAAARQGRLTGASEGRPSEAEAQLEAMDRVGCTRYRSLFGVPPGGALARHHQSPLAG